MFLKRKGFTLAELIIVIIFIVILAGGLMLYLSSASDSARVATLISELRNARSAGVIWFADNNSLTDAEHVKSWDKVTMRKIFIDNNYMDNPEKVNKLEFVLEPQMNDDIHYLIGIKVERRILKKVLRQTKGILLFGSGLPQSGSTKVVYIRVR